MKKLLWCAVVVAVLCVVTVIILSANPDNAILAISQSSGREYEEMVVLKRDRTYEQLLRRKSDGSIVSHTGTWVPSKEDVNSRLFSAQTGTQLSDGYITYKDKLNSSGKSGALEIIDMAMEQPFGMRPPDEKTLSVWKQWHAQSKPFRAAGSTSNLFTTEVFLCKIILTTTSI